VAVEWLCVLPFNAAGEEDPVGDAVTVGADEVRGLTDC
jgi:hypothetical protein